MKVIKCIGVCVVLIELAIPVLFFRLDQYKQKPIVVIIPSYKNERWVEKNLKSVFNQKYDNYRVIYVNDCSPDATGAMAEKIIDECSSSGRTRLINNSTRVGAMENLYHAIHLCKDNEIVVVLDGDDWFAHDYVLAYINCIYANKDIWLTYGQFQEYPSTYIGHLYSMPFPKSVVENNSFRLYRSLPISHLRTFYAWLFKEIKCEDLMKDGKFYSMSSDKAMMAPMIEMAGTHWTCINEILYIYNNSNPINDHRVDVTLQHALADEIAHKTPYLRVEKPLLNEVA